MAGNSSSAANLFFNISVTTISSQPPASQTSSLPTMTSGPTWPPTQVPTTIPSPTATSSVPSPITPTVTSSCPPVTGVFAKTWFQIQNKLGCANRAVINGLIVEENFQRGKMLWREPVDDAQALALFSDGTWRGFRQNATIGAKLLRPASEVCETPLPSGGSC